ATASLLRRARRLALARRRSLRLAGLLALVPLRLPLAEHFEEALLPLVRVDAHRDLAPLDLLQARLAPALRRRELGEQRVLLRRLLLAGLVGLAGLLVAAVLRRAFVGLRRSLARPGRVAVGRRRAVLRGTQRFLALALALGQLALQRAHLLVGQLDDDLVRLDVRPAQEDEAGRVIEVVQPDPGVGRLAIGLDEVDALGALDEAPVLDHAAQPRAVLQLHADAHVVAVGPPDPHVLALPRDLFGDAQLVGVHRRLAGLADRERRQDEQENGCEVGAHRWPPC